MDIPAPPPPAAGDCRWSATGISIDTRSLEKGDLIALAGPNFDGHDFVDAAFQAGAAAALVARRVIEGAAGLVSDDTPEAMQALGAAARARTGAKIAAITGSVGKPAPRKHWLIFSPRRERPDTVKTASTITWAYRFAARLPASAAFGVFEIGMNHAGEITPLVSLVRPHVAVVTAIALRTANSSTRLKI